MRLLHFCKQKMNLLRCANINSHLLSFWFLTRVRNYFLSFQKFERPKLFIIVQSIYRIFFRPINLQSHLIHQVELRFFYDGNFKKCKVASTLFFQDLDRDIHIECSKQFKQNLYFYVSGPSRLFWAVLKLPYNSNMKSKQAITHMQFNVWGRV